VAGKVEIARVVLKMEVIGEKKKKQKKKKKKDPKNGPAA
jgi:hypothetical protein